MAVTNRIFTLWLACGAVAAQAQTPTEPARLVRLNVVATDANGQPAAGLTADDFQVTDQGKAQHIALFRDDAQPRPGELSFSNRLAPGGHAAVILLDFLNQSRTERIEAGRKIGPILKQLPSGESLLFYLLAPDGKLIPLHEFAAIADKTWNRDAETLVAAALKEHNRDRPAGMSVEDVVKKTYVALETLATGLSVFPGRKDILWVTAGIPYVMNPQIQCKADWWDCALYVPHLTVSLERTGVAVNPLPFTSLNVNASRSLEELAGLTGGRAYLNQDMAAALKQFGDSTGVYSLAYAPPATGWDSKYHRLKIACERKGVKLQAKLHYYAAPDQREAPARQQALLVAAFRSSSDVAEVGLRAALAQSAPNTLRIQIRVDPADLLLHPDGVQFTDRLTLLLSARTASGPQGDPAVADLDLHLTREQLEDARKNGIPIVKEYPIDAATQSVRIIVLDRAADSMGSLTVPVRPVEAAAAGR
jgi:VWFA-related protein